MIISKLQGGLGNQLFQWAVVESYSIENKCDYKFDTTFYYSQDMRSVRINNIPGIKFNIATHTDITRDITFVEDNFHYNPIPNNGNIIYLNGYWQSEKYFIKNKDRILEILSVPDKCKMTPLIDTNSVSMHIRRTDYLSSNGYHPVQPMTYYENALDIIGNYDYLFIFSDDIQWCKENLKFNNCIFMENFSDIDDLFIMSMCKNNIIANSSFSWWGAWLNRNVDKKVIAPKRWFGPQSVINESDIIPQNWIKI